MRYFQEMVECARINGIYKTVRSGSAISTEIEPVTKEVFDVFFKCVELCQPFVFLNNILPVIAIDQTETKNFIQKSRDVEIDAPFPVFSIESLEGSLRTEALTYDSVTIYTKVICLMVIEISPKETFCYCFYGAKDDSWKKVLVDQTDRGLVKHYLNRLQTEKTGLEAVRTSLRIGTGSNKRVHRIRRVIHVRPKKQANNEASGNSKIDWSHRYEVRGHWRKIDTLGKDREDNYTVQGYTWVRNHIRGPESLPLIKKTRVVLDFPNPT